MASLAGTPSFPSTKEKINFDILCRLLVENGSRALRVAFDAIHPPAVLHTVLNQESEHAILQSLKKKRILNPTQWGKLYPMPPSSVSSANFDITLLVVLLRNICGLAPPSTGWDSLPLAADLSMEANIARLKYYRNTVCGHASQASVDDATFNSYWENISNAILGLAGEDYETTINEVKNGCMDPRSEEQYKKLLKQWQEDEDNIKEDIRDMEENIRGDIKQLRTEVGEIGEKVVCQKTRQEETKGPGDAGIAALAQSVGHNNSLKHLAMSGNCMGDEGARVLAESLRDNKSLTELYLSGNGISDVGAVALAECLKGNTSLTKLDLSRNNVADAGAAALAECLKDNTTLTALSLSHNNIGSVGVAALAKCFEGLASLTEYDLSQ